jgi:hypothetical protein
MELERTVWTDERLQDRFDSIDRQFGELRGDIRDLGSLMFQLWGATMLAVIASMVVTVVAAIITRT